MTTISQAESGLAAAPEQRGAVLGLAQESSPHGRDADSSPFAVDISPTSSEAILEHFGDPEFLATQSRKLLREASLVADQTEVMLTLPDDQIATVVLEFCQGALIPAARRRSRVQVLLSDEAVLTAAGRDLIRSMGCSGVLLRRSHQPLPDVGIFGRRLAIWRPCGEVPGWLCSTHPKPVNNALRIFRAVWRTSAPLGNPEPEEVLSDLETSILQHLVNGSKDESAARALNVSTRTYRRHVTAMCCRLGASSRFEAGAKAALAGWIPPLPQR